MLTTTHDNRGPLLSEAVEAPARPRRRRWQPNVWQPAVLAAWEETDLNYPHGIEDCRTAKQADKLMEKQDAIVQFAWEEMAEDIDADEALARIDAGINDLMEIHAAIDLSAELLDECEAQA